MYKNILGPESTSADITMRCILAVPRSGSTFVHIFLHVYNALLNKQPITDQDLIYDGLDEVVVNGARIITDHAECPGFRAIAKPEKLAQWDALCDSKPVSYFLGKPPSEFTSDFVQNSAFLSTKMVFLFRNPLDQVLSLFKYCTSSKQSDFPKVDLDAFIHNEHMFNLYIKLFYPFHIVRQHHPDMLLCIPYEQLLTDKYNILRHMLAHLGIIFDQDAFARALELTSMESLQCVEQRLGRSLRGGEGDKHIRSGKTGLWKDHMSLELVQYIEEHLNQFSLSLNMFIIDEKSDAKFDIANDSVPVTVPGTLTLGKNSFGWLWILQQLTSEFEIQDETRIDPKQNQYQLVIYSKPRV